MDELDVAFAGVIATGAVGVGTLLAAFFGGRADRRHARQLAQDERLFDSRVTLYEDALAQATRDMLAMDRTYPEVGSQPNDDPPPPVSDKEWTRLVARIGALASDDVHTALKTFMEKRLGFAAQAMTFRMMEAEGRKVAPEDYREIERLRKEASDQLGALADQINEELTAPVS
jgi:hypothetical protein